MNEGSLTRDMTIARGCRGISSSCRGIECSRKAIADAENVNAALPLHVANNPIKIGPLCLHRGWFAWGMILLAVNVRILMILVSIDRLFRLLLDANIVE